MTSYFKYIRNIGSMALSRIAGMLLGIINVAILSRYLGVEKYGDYTFALNFVALFVPLIDLGIGNVLTREIVKQKEAAYKYIYNLIFLRIILSFLAIFAALSIASFFMQISVSLLALILIASIPFFATAIGATQSYFIATYRMHILSLIMVCTGIFSTLSLFILIGLKKSIYYLLLSQVLVTLLGSVIIFIYCVKATGYSPPRFAEIKFLFKESFLFGLAGIFTTIYFKANSTIVYSILGAQPTGLFNAAYKFLDLLGPFIGILMASFYPLLSEKSGNMDAFRKTFNDVWLTMMIIGGFGTLVVAMNSELIIQLIYGKNFIEAGNYLLILSPAITSICLGNVVGYSAISLGLQKQYLKSAMITSIVNITITWLLTKNIGLSGAAIASVITEITSLSILTAFLFNKIGKSVSYKKIISLIVLLGVCIFLFKMVMYQNNSLLLQIISSVMFVCLYLFGIYKLRIMPETLFRRIEIG